MRHLRLREDMSDFDLDGFLNETGITSDTPPQEETPEVFPPGPAVTNEEFNDILSDLGISIADDSDTPQDDTDEEEWDDEESEEQEEENTEETQVRDLDAEEDADWQEAIDSARVTPVRMTTAAMDEAFAEMIESYNIFKL